MNLDQDLSVWNPCVLPDCQPGGTGIPTKIVIAETGTKWPPNALEISETGPIWTNLLVLDKVGATNASQFAGDFWVNLPASYPTNYQAIEFDMFAFNSPYRWMFGFDCVTNGFWQVWNDFQSQWINTKLACQLSAGWHHIQLWAHRVTGETDCVSGMPCMYFDMIGVDQTYTNLVGTKEPASWIPAGWGNDSGIQFQLGLTGNFNGTRTITEYVQRVNFTETGD